MPEGRCAEVVLSPRLIVLHALAAGSVDPRRTVEGPALEPFTSFLAPLAFAASLPVLATTKVVASRAVVGEVAVGRFSPLVAGESLTMAARAAGLWDLGAYAVHRVVVTFSRLAEPAGEVTLDFFEHGAGGFGGGSPPRAPRRLPPARPPDAVDAVNVPLNAALLYRLLGDDNPLHVDAAAAAAWPELTQGRPILHGLAGLGLVERVLTERHGALTSIRCRFARPIWPGDTLALESWQNVEGLQLRLRGPTHEVWTNSAAEIVRPRS